MSVVPHPSNEVFAFSIPVVKGTRVDFGLLVSAGLAQMHAERALVVDLARSLADVCGFELVVRAPRPATNGFAFTSEKRAQYVAAYRAFRAGKWASMKACAFGHGINYQSWFQWCQRHADTLEREVSDPAASRPRLPITKPGGALL